MGSTRASDRYRGHRLRLEILLAYGWVLGFLQLRGIARLRKRKLLPEKDGTRRDG